MNMLLLIILGVLVVWLALAISLNLRDTRKRKRLQRRRQQLMAHKTVPVEQVMRLAEWKMEQWMRLGAYHPMMERDKLN
jgi:predicted Holliday junction resolvase-like endonuclease